MYLVRDPGTYYYYLFIFEFRTYFYFLKSMLFIFFWSFSESLELFFLSELGTLVFSGHDKPDPGNATGTRDNHCKLLI